MGQITSLAMPDNNLIMRFAEQPPQIGQAFDQALQASRQQQLQRYQLSQQLAQAQQFKAAQQAYISNPNAQTYNTLVTLDPKSAEAIKSGYGALDTQTRNDELRRGVYIRGLLSQGDQKGAAVALQQRIDADRAAGHDTSGDEEMLALINAHPETAGAAIDYHLAALAGGPDKYFGNVETAGKERRADAELPGKIAKNEADTARAHFIEAGGQVYPINSGPAAPAAAPAAGLQQAGGAPSAPATIPGPAGQAVMAAADKVGATPQDKDYLARTAALESSGRPDAQNGSSTGIFQMQPKTFQGLGGKDINDVGQQTVATLRSARQNAKQMKGMIGRQPTAAELYLAHQQGATGASGLIGADPNTNAIEALVGVGVSPAKAKASILGNGGTADMTAGQFVQKWQAAYNGVGQPAGGALAGGSGGDAPGVTATDAQGNRYSLGAPVGGTGDDDTLDPDAVTMNAMRYAMTGVLPATGTGKQAAADKKKILNRAGQLIKQYNIQPEDWVTGMAQFKVTQGSLAKLQQQRVLIEAFEKTAIDNGKLALSLAPKGAGPFNSPILNRWVQTGRKAVLGDPGVTQFDVALGSYLDEYAKITSGAMGNTPTSDAARKEAYDRMSKYASQRTLAGAFEVMNTEMHNRTLEQRNQEAALTEQLRHGIVPAGSALEPAAPPPGAPPSAAPAQSPQIAAAMRYKGNDHITVGQQGNPYLVKTQAQYDALKPGQWYIDTDGAVVQKRKGG